MNRDQVAGYVRKYVGKGGRTPNSVKAVEQLAPIFWKGTSSSDWFRIAENYRGMRVALEFMGQYKAASIAGFLGDVAWKHAAEDYAVPSQGGLFNEP